MHDSDVKQYTEADLQEGMVIPDKIFGSIKIMAIRSGYIMARRKRAYPFCVSVGQFIRSINAKDKS